MFHVNDELPMSVWEIEGGAGGGGGGGGNRLCVDQAHEKNTLILALPWWKLVKKRKGMVNNITSV